MNKRLLLASSQLFIASQSTVALLQPSHILDSISKSNLHRMNSSSQESQTWSSSDPADSVDARKRLNIWPLDDDNAKLLDEVHPKSWPNTKEDTVYDLIAIGAGAGGLVSSRQVARRGGRSVMISAHLAGGDCLNVGCVPSKALIRSARMIREVRKAQSHPEFGVQIGGSVDVDFNAIMQRMRKLRAEIAPVDGHERGKDIGVDVFQGFGRFVDESTIEVVPSSGDEDPIRLKFKKAAICTGGRATIPDNIPGLKKAPYTTNETLFNLGKLPNHMVILGSGVVALEMAQVFATYGSKVTVLVRSDTLFPRSDPDAGPYLQKSLEESSNVEFVKLAKLQNVETLRDADGDDLPLMKLSISANGEEMEIESDCLLVAAGRTPNVENLNLEAANVDFDVKQGILVDDLSKSVSNPNVFSVGDCTAGVPRLTHMSGEMAKVVVNNAIFDDDWKLSSLVVPACMYTEPEFASVGDVTGDNDSVDIYTASLEHIDRAILDGDREGYVKIFCKKGTGTIVGCSLIAGRAGELINEVTLAMKHNIPLEGIGRNIHCYPTTGDAVMGCGLQLINSKWKRLD